MKEITITILTSNDEDVVKEVRKNLMELHWKMRKDICHTKIKVKNKKILTTRKLRKNFMVSKDTQKSIVKSDVINGIFFE